MDLMFVKKTFENQIQISSFVVNRSQKLIKIFVVERKICRLVQFPVSLKSRIRRAAKKSDASLTATNVQARI